MKSCFEGKSGRIVLIRRPGLLSVAVMALLFLSCLMPFSAEAQQGDRYHGIIIATKEGAQSLEGSYKFRAAEADDVSTSNRDGVQARGNMAFSGGNMTGSVSYVDSAGGTGSIGITGTTSPSPAGFSMTITNQSTPEHYTLNLSPDGEFLMGTRGETENGHSRQMNFAAVRGNDLKQFTDTDASGTWLFRSFELYDIESSYREAAVCYGTATAASSQGSIQVTCIEDDLSEDYGEGLITYSLRLNGEADFYVVGEPTPLFTAQLSSDGYFMVASSDEAGTQHITIGMKRNPAKTFSAANVNGTYRWQLFRVKNFSSNTPEAQNGYGIITFDGAGNWSASVTNIYVSNYETFSGQSSGTYSVTANGEITLITTTGGIGPNDVMHGYISRDDATVVLTQAIFVQNSVKYGSLQVYIEPQGARSAGAKWRRTGTSTWHDSGYIESGVPVGTQNVEFSAVTGWVKPANSMISIVENQTSGLTGTYTALGGTAVVNVTPDNASWTLSGPAGFEGNGISYSGDRTFSNAPAGTYTWTGQDLPLWDTPSTQTISLSTGDTISFTRSWTQTPPVSNFTAVPAQGISPLTVQFTDMSWGTIHTKTWNFGDGSTLINATNPTHTYQIPGTYQATLTVAGPLPSTPPENAVYTVSIMVDYPPPSASFTMNPPRGESPLQVVFEDHSTGDITSWSWSFGDGENSTDQNPQHVFNGTGVYPVTLQVTGPGGTRSASGTVIVYKILYVNRNDDKCGDKSPCYTAIQSAMDTQDPVKMIRVTQGSYPEEVQQSQSQTVIIQGGNNEAFSSTPPSRTTVSKISGTGGTFIPENLIVGPASSD